MYMALSLRRHLADKVQPVVGKRVVEIHTEARDEDVLGQVGQRVDELAQGAVAHGGHRVDHDAVGAPGLGECGQRPAPVLPLVVRLLKDDRHVHVAAVEAGVWNHAGVVDDLESRV